MDTASLATSILFGKLFDVATLLTSERSGVVKTFRYVTYRMEIDWLKPWWSTASQDDEFHRTFNDQLALELSSGHPLFGIDAHVVARRSGCDDALFELLDGTGRYAVVHLTWGSQQTPPWPSTQIYSSVRAFIDDCMVPDHNESLD